MIKQIKITTLLLSFSFIGFGQELPKQKSENHIQIKGTNIFMVPPTLFESSNNFKGFQSLKAAYLTSGFRLTGIGLWWPQIKEN